MAKSKKSAFTIPDTVSCGGCGVSAPPAAFALMHERDIEAASLTPHVMGPGAFHAVGVCKECHQDPAHRKVPLKAHFALPHTNALYVALGAAGSSTGIST